MKVFFVNDSTTNPNWGDRAAAIALRQMISDSEGVISKTIYEEELYGDCFSNKRNNKKEIVRESVFGEVTRLCVPPVLLKAREKLRSILVHSAVDNAASIIPDKWEGFPSAIELIRRDKDRCSDLMAAIEEADLLVIHGGGCMVGNARIARAELLLAYLAKTHFKKPVIIVNHTADFDHPNLQKIAREVYPLFDDIVFRDLVSVERCRDFCNGRFAADSAFLFKPISMDSWLPVSQRLNYFDVWPDRAHFIPGEPYICIGGSSIYYYNKNYDVERGFSQLINHIRSIYSGQIVLTASDLRDQTVFRPIAKRLNLPLVGLSTPVQQSVDIVGNAEAYIGGRWHPSIFALRGGTPIVPLSSLTFKMQALAEMAGLSNATFNALDLEREKTAIGRQLESYLEQGAELRYKLSRWAEKEAVKSWENIAYLRSMEGNP
jgi:polysaccharide pyruvyl transferase WcaK-like protein